MTFASVTVPGPPPTPSSNALRRLSSFVFQLRLPMNRRVPGAATAAILPGGWNNGVCVWWEGRTHVAKSGRPGSIGNEVSVEALPAERRVVVKPLSTRGPQCGCFKGLAKTALRGRASHAAGANTSLRRQNAPVRAQWRRCRRYSCASVQPPFRRRVRLAQCPRSSPQPTILRWAPKRLGIEAWQVHLPKESGAMKGGRRPKKQVSHR